MNVYLWICFFIIQHEENPTDYQRIVLSCYSFGREGKYLEPQEIIDIVEQKLNSEEFNFLSDYHKRNLKLVWRNNIGAKNSKVEAIIQLFDS
jgi:hypothetical protein